MGREENRRSIKQGKQVKGMRERKSKKEKRKKKKDLEIEISSKEEPASNSEGHNIKVYEDIFLCLG